MNLLPSLCSALQRTLKQLVTRFNPLKLSEHRAITLLTVGNVDQCALSWFFNYWSRPKIDHKHVRRGGAHKIRGAISGFNKPECKGDIKFLESCAQKDFLFYGFCVFTLHCVEGNAVTLVFISILPLLLQI